MDIEGIKPCDNLRFYRNEILSRPPQGYTVEIILQHHGDYKFLDEYPYFIKWLFPTPSSLDVNTQALLPFEAKAITDDRVTFGRVKQAYELVLDYYGIKMVDEYTGELKKSKHWKSRWNVLNVSSHPELRRITRVLASLGELGCKRYQVPLIEYFIKNKKDIVAFEWIIVLYWIDTVKDDGEREQLFEKYGKQVFSDKTLTSFSRPTVELTFIERKSKNYKQVDDGECIPRSSLSDKRNPLKAETTSYSCNLPLQSETNRGLTRSTLHDTEDRIDSKPSIHLNSKEKLWRPESANIDKNIDSKLQNDDTPFSSLPDRVLSPNDTSAHSKDMDIEGIKPCDNLRFYRNEILSRPPQGHTIDTILQHHGDYKFLDEYPYFIKWLFPTPSSLDVNTQALLPFEAKAIIDDRVTFGRVKQAYELVLDYYGIKMVDGELKKSKHWKSRWNVLNVSSRPELRRITRVLASLGELGCKRYQVPLIEYFIKNKKDIAEFEWITVLYWIDTVKDDGEREQLFEKYGKQVFSDKTLNLFSRP